MSKLLEKKELAREIRRLADLANDESREWTKDDEAEWQKKTKRYDAIKTELDEDRNRSNPGRPDAVAGGASITDEFADCEYFRDIHTGRKVPILRADHSFEKYATRNLTTEDVRHRAGGLDIGTMLRALVVGCENDVERRALAEGTDSAGGYTVPTILSSQLIDAMRKKSRVFQAGAVSVPLDSNKHHFAKLLTDPTPGWRAEAAPVAESDPTFGRVEFVPKSLAVQVKVSEELLQDSVNIGPALQNSLSQALSLEVDRAALLGSGSSNEPAGMDTFSSINSVSMGANGGAISDYDPVLDAIEDLQEDNAGEVTAAIMAPRTLRVFNGLKDTTNQPLMRPPSIANLPFLETTQVPIDQTQGTATDASSIYLGNFSDLVIGFRQRLRIEILKELHRGNLQVGFLAHLRCDVQAWHEESFAKIVGVIP